MFANINFKIAAFFTILVTIFTGIGMYGQRKKQEGKASVKDEINKQREIENKVLRDIRVNTPITGNVEWLLNDAKRIHNKRTNS